MCRVTWSQSGTSKSCKNLLRMTISSESPVDFAPYFFTDSTFLCL
jgi:hypothetical protein